MRPNTRHALLLALLATMTVGCSGGRAIFIAPNCRAPVSYTSSVPTTSGEFYSIQSGTLRTVGYFARRIDRLSILESLVPLGPRTVDLSTFFNALLDEYGGDAIVNLKISAGTGGFGALAAISPLGLILPGNIACIVSGEVASSR